MHLQAQKKQMLMISHPITTHLWTAQEIQVYCMLSICKIRLISSHIKHLNIVKGALDKYKSSPIFFQKKLWLLYHKKSWHG